MAPRFWHRPAGPVLRALGRLAPGIGRRTVPAPVPVPVPVPVIAVGSLSLGGTGKTPTVIAVAQRLAMQGRAVHVVCRGGAAPLQVDLARHAFGEVGDEALLIAAFAPSWTAANAAEGVRAAAAAGAEIVVTDAGFPSPVAARATLLVEDAQRGFGNGLAWPLGPLKQRLMQGISQADLLVTIGPPEAQAAFSRAHPQLPLPRAEGHLAVLATGMDWDGLEVVAFAGIEAPERFFATLRGLGAQILRAQALSDHQELTPTLMARLENEARARHAQLVTTEKDAVRLPASFRAKVVSLPVRLELDDWGRLDALLESVSRKT